VNGWLTDLENENVRPYAIAKPLLNMVTLEKVLNRLKNRGYIINIISWLSKTSTPAFDEAVTKTKKEWLKRYLPNVKFDNIYVVPYGTPKHNISSGILFDDEKNNRDNWGTGAYDVDNILNILQSLE
jgi:5'(3')-deoxyribonucleotidase